ncbi:NmrA family NAD(P)-binding protein [Nonomuraea sp. LPB2021202275-12-8]|uniref:NmrA family NAD(P)-binding protein n=1 Tax=Nonomuraea sp. LPB2021202275-12-8 TaxID=3120159 RepID=UPI00300C4417
MTYLVTGATGRTGRQVVDHLLQAGQQVRALTRDPAKAALPPQVEVVAGDLTAPETLGPAFDGVTGVHLLAVGGDDYATLRTGPEIVELALKAGVRRATVLWNGHVGPVEEAVEASELEWTRLQPGDFMSNTLGWAEPIRTKDAVREPFGDVPSAMVHEADVGAVAAAVLVEPGHARKIYTLTGPEALSSRQRLDIIAATIGRKLRFEELTEEQAREDWRQAGHSEEFIEVLATWRRNPPPEAYTVVSTVEDITGRPPRTFADWVASHAARFK